MDEGTKKRTARPVRTDASGTGRKAGTSSAGGARSTEKTSGRTKTSAGTAKRRTAVSRSAAQGAARSSAADPSAVKKKRVKRSAASRQDRERARKISRWFRIGGRVLAILQIVLSVILLFRMGRTGFFPTHLMVITAIVLFAAAFILLFLNLTRSRKKRKIGCIISAVMCILLLLGIRYINQTIGLIGVGNEAYKTDDMVVAVKAGSTAEDITDCADYTFGYNVTDTTGGPAIIQEINTLLGKEVALKEYKTEVEVAQALMDNEVDAASYNQAYDSVLCQVVRGYEGNVKIIHHYGVRTDFEQANIGSGESFNVLISGIDVYGDISQTSRSDVNIIMTVNPRSKRIIMTSTPRDYYVKIPDVSGDELDKLTHAGIYGVDASMRTLSELYGINIDYFIRVNFDTLIKLVDALGGLDIYVEYAFDAYTDDFHFDRGWHHMNGDQALAFCRERYSFADGDNQRGRDQEQVLDALLDKLMSPAILMSVGELLNDLEGSYQTNIPESKIVELVNMQLSDGAMWNIHKQTADEGYGELQPTYSGGSQPLYVMWPDMGSVKRNRVRIMMIFNEEPGGRIQPVEYTNHQQ